MWLPILNESTRHLSEFTSNVDRTEVLRYLKRRRSSSDIKDFILAGGTDYHGDIVWNLLILIEDYQYNKVSISEIDITTDSDGVIVDNSPSFGLVYAREKNKPVRYYQGMNPDDYTSVEIGSDFGNEIEITDSAKNAIDFDKVAEELVAEYNNLKKYEGMGIDYIRRTLDGYSAMLVADAKRGAFSK